MNTLERIQAIKELNQILFAASQDMELRKLVIKKLKELIELL